MLKQPAKCTIKCVDLGERTSTKADQEQRFHDELKTSVTLRKYTEVVDSVPTTQDDIGRQLKELHENLRCHKRMQTYIKCLMGRNLSLLQNENKKDFITLAHQYLPTSYSRSEIYFMIKLYKLSEDFPRISFVTLPIRVMKAKFKLIEKLVLEDSDYWKNTD